DGSHLFFVLVYYLNVNCIHSFSTSFGIKFNAVIFVDVVYQTTFVYEDIFFSVFCCDKSKTFCSVEELNCSFCHNIMFKKMYKIRHLTNDNQKRSRPRHLWNKVKKVELKDIGWINNTKFY